MYFHYIFAKYGLPTVVFDGCSCGPTIKDVTHARRGNEGGGEVLYTADMKLLMRKEQFLSCKANKARFLADITAHFRSKFVTVLQAKDDADVLIV